MRNSLTPKVAEFRILYGIKKTYGIPFMRNSENTLLQQRQAHQVEGGLINLKWEPIQDWGPAVCHFLDNDNHLTECEGNLQHVPVLPREAEEAEKEAVNNRLSVMKETPKSTGVLAPAATTCLC
jgi:hypothetical protein